eukprot:738483_1
MLCSNSQLKTSLLRVRSMQVCCHCTTSTTSPGCPADSTGACDGLICTKYVPSCCTVAWDSDCVDKATALCTNGCILNSTHPACPTLAPTSAPTTPTLDPTTPEPTTLTLAPITPAPTTPAPITPAPTTPAPTTPNPTSAS